jgi:hypothetical protein
MDKIIHQCHCLLPGLTLGLTCYLGSSNFIASAGSYILRSWWVLNVAWDCCPTWPLCIGMVQFHSEVICFGPAPSLSIPAEFLQLRMPWIRVWLSNNRKELGSCDPQRKKLWGDYVIFLRQKKLLYRNFIPEMSSSWLGTEHALKKQAKGLAQKTECSLRGDDEYGWL